MADIQIKSITFPDLPDRYTFLQSDTTLTQSGKAADSKVVGDKITGLEGDISQTKEEGTVPTSEQMLSGNYTEDSVPYNFRKTASDNADREELEIVGGSVAWNQLAVLTESFVKPNACTRTLDTATGVYTLNATNFSTLNFGFYVYLPGRAGHKIMFSVKLNPDSALTNIKFGRGDAQSKVIAIPASTYTTFSAIAEATSDGTFICYSDISQLGLSSLTMLVKNIQCIDITQALGSTIADHIYALEQTTAGAGVALFKSLFPKDYYPYDAGSMQSVSGLSAHKTTGFNQWDEEWRNGAYNTSDGSFAANTTYFANKNPIPVIPNATYYIGSSVNATWNLFYYDADMNYIGSEQRTNDTFVTSQNTHYINFSSATTFYGVVYKNDICINLSDPAKNGTYEPYDGHSYALDDSLTLRGVPTLVDGKIKWDGDLYSPSGKVTRRFGIVDLGTLNWTRAAFAVESESAYTFYAADIGIKKGYNNSNLAPMICSKYLTVSYYVTGSTYKDLLDTDKSIAFGYNSGNRLNVRDDSYTDAAAFKAAMSGVYLVFKLETPTSEQEDPYIGTQICSPYGTEEFVSTGIVPVGHNTKYPDNLRMKLDNLPWNFASLIAPTESGFKATRNYTTGNLLIVNNVLYKATANIANGATITPNTNVTATTLAEVIAALS